MDILSRLPPELLIEVLKSLTSLQSVLSLLHASPAVARFFRAHGAVVAESLIKTTLPPVLQPLARSLCVLRTASPDRLPFGTDAYHQQFVVGRVGDRVLADLLDATPNPRSVVTWARRISRLERAVIDRLCRTSEIVASRRSGSPEDPLAVSYPTTSLLLTEKPSSPEWTTSSKDPFRVRRALWRIATVLAMPPARIQMKQLAWAGSADLLFQHPRAGHNREGAPFGIAPLYDECQRLILPCVWRAMPAWERHENACVYACLRLMLGRSPLGGDDPCAPIGGGALLRAAVNEPIFRGDDAGEWAERGGPYDNADADLEDDASRDSAWQWYAYALNTVHEFYEP